MKIAAPAYRKDGVFFHVIPALVPGSLYTSRIADSYRNLRRPLGIGTSLPFSPSK